MKSICSLLMALAFCNMVSAQDLPNSNFENWTTDANNRDSLIGWSSTNSVVLSAMIKPLVKDTDAFQGDYAAELVTVPFGIVQWTKIAIMVNGTGTFDWGNSGNGIPPSLVSGGGTPISYKPTTLNGYYKCESAPGDNGFARILLTKYNTTLQKRDTISYTEYDFAPVANYTPFSITLVDLMPGVTPDSITTIFYSSNPNTVAEKGVWSNLYLDSITLVNPNPPTVDFAADSTTGTMNTIVHFYDSSKNSPDSWQWTFTPDHTAFQEGTTNTSQNPVVKFTQAGDYSVKLVATNTNGSDSVTKTDYIHIEATESITTVNPIKNIAVYPNPAKEALYLNTDCAGASVQITDICGRIMQQGKVAGNNSIDISGLDNGFYFLKIGKNGQTLSRKFVVQK